MFSIFKTSKFVKASIPFRLLRPLFEAFREVIFFALLAEILLKYELVPLEEEDNPELAVVVSELEELPVLVEVEEDDPELAVVVSELEELPVLVEVEEDDPELAVVVSELEELPVLVEVEEDDPELAVVVSELEELPVLVEVEEDDPELAVELSELEELPVVPSDSLLDVVVLVVLDLSTPFVTERTTVSPVFLSIIVSVQEASIPNVRTKKDAKIIIFLYMMIPSP